MKILLLALLIDMQSGYYVVCRHNQHGTEAVFWGYQCPIGWTLIGSGFNP